MLTPQVLYKFCTRNCSGFKRLFTRKSQDFERLGLSIEKHFNLKFSQIVKFSKIRENIQRQSCCFVIWDSTRCFPGKCHRREFCTQKNPIEENRREIQTLKDFILCDFRKFFEKMDGVFCDYIQFLFLVGSHWTRIQVVNILNYGTDFAFTSFQCRL